MTNKEALLAVVQTSVPDNSVEKALVDAEIVAGEQYSPSQMKEIDLCAIELLRGLLSTPDISEGQYSIKLDRKAVQERLGYLEGKHGLSSSSQPRISGVSIW